MTAAGTNHDARTTLLGERFRETLGTTVRDSLSPVAIGLAVVYGVVAAIHAVNGSMHVAAPLCMLASATSATLLLIWYILRMRPISADSAHPLAALMAGMVLLNILLHLYVIREPRGTTLVSLLMVSVGCLFLSWKWLTLTLIIVNVLTACVAWSANLTTDWLDLVYTQVGPTVLSLFVYMVRIGTLRRLEIVRVHDEQHKRELEEARRRAEESARAKSEFLANMSHEIRTPMTAILGYADVLLQEHRQNKALSVPLETMKRNGEHLLQIINDILDVSKIDAGKMHIERLRCCPFQTVSEVQSLMQIRAEETGLPIQIEYDGLIPETIETDPTRLRQILINLVGNAIKFTKQGSVRIVTRFIAHRDDGGGPDDLTATSMAGRQGFLQFEVIDTGIGMTKHQAAKLFQPFTQADTSTTRQFGGTGLGLTISKRLAAMLGGDIGLETELGRGSTFRVTIATGPLDGVLMVPQPRHGIQQKAALPEKESAPPETDPLDCRLLLVEDGIDNQRLISFVLKKAGADVTVAENGQVAVELALEAVEVGSPFDVILMDMQMPVLDGYSATRLLREKEYAGPIVALTAHAMSGDREKCIAAGCDEFATKPIDRQRLIQCIRDQLSRPREPLSEKPSTVGH